MNAVYFCDPVTVDTDGSCHVPKPFQTLWACLHSWALLGLLGRLLRAEEHPAQLWDWQSVSK